MCHYNKNTLWSMTLSALLADAVEQYQLALAAESYCSTVHCNLAAALAAVGLHRPAITAAEAALTINKGYAKVKTIGKL